ncbi:MAG TPA: serine/threonine-protein kinase [Thermoanaerobaculia bacterium]
MAPAETPCPRCGASLPGEAKFCPSCGYRATRITAGQTLDGKYEIIEKIGEGGMGEVYKARHVHLDEIRIIKVTKPDPLGEGPEPRRFQEEARIATLVRHPNVAALYDFSRLPDGSYYMVWEYIDGITLEEWLRRNGPLPARRALEVSAQVLAGLGQIHAQGIVHRDLSPDNIMLRETRDRGLVAKIIDLGIAKRVAAEAIQMTGTGMFLGKLKYCSPEQAGALTSGQKVDGRSDLYSFGIVLFEMLTGKPPFESQTPEGYLGKHLHTQAPPLDTSRLPTKVGPGLAGIVRRALEKDRSRRFQSADEFAAALAGLRPSLEDPTDSLPTTAMSAARRSNRYTLALAAGIVLTLAAGLFVIKRRSDHPRAAVRPPTPAPTAAAAIPTVSAPDDVVVAPRILENATPSPAAERIVPTRVPVTHPPVQGAVPPPPPAVQAPPPPPPPAEATPAVPRLPDGSEITAPRLSRMVENWTGKPLERRAEEAVRLAYLVRYYSNAHAGDSFAQETKQSLSKGLKEDAEIARSNRRPAIEAKFLVARLELEPTDEESLRRLGEIQKMFARRKGKEN